MDGSKTVVIVPTINEFSGLSKIIPKLSRLKVDILVVDDNSNDGTRELLTKNRDRLGRKFDCILRSRSNGFRGAYFAGFNKVKCMGYQQIIMIDGDGAHDPEVIPKMLKKIESGFDLVIGSRYAKGGEVVSFPFWRALSSKCSNWLIKSFISAKISDWTSGFIAIKADLLEKIIGGDYAKGFSFLVQLKKYAIDNGATVAELPIQFSNCKNIKSKFNFAIALEAVRTFWKLVITQ